MTKFKYTTLIYVGPKQSTRNVKTEKWGTLIYRESGC